MKEINEEKDRRIVVVIEDKDDVATEQNCLETPTITIESDDTPEVSPTPQQPHHNRKWPFVVASVLITLLVCMALGWGYRYYTRYINIGVPVSVTSKENINLLSARPQ